MQVILARRGMNPILAGALLLVALTCNAATIEGRVVGVADGDTITVLDSTNTQHKIRLSGIDAPEKSQPFGNLSKESLSGLVFDKTVTVETDKRDKYKRNVGKVLVDGADANLEQIKRGMAWHYKKYAREQPAADRKAYSDAEDAAKAVRRGLWADTEHVPPWEFRQIH
jgi:endonuclease YncB( thermonuclease family)